MKKEIKELEKLCLKESNEHYLKNKEVAHDLGFKIERELLITNYTKEEIIELIKLLLSLGQSKNRLSRYVEDNLQKRVTDLVFRVNYENFQGDFIDIKEIDEENVKIEKYKFISKILYDFSLNVLAIKIEKNKYCDDRRANALRILVDLIEYYKITDVLNIFEKSINEKRKNELFFAIHGIEKYFKIYEKEKLEKTLRSKIESTLEKVEDSMIKNMCVNILY